MPPPDAIAGLLAEVQSRFSATPDPRLRQILLALMPHLHQLATELHLTPMELERGIKFLTAVGQRCTPDRQEFMLLSDVLGLSSAVEVVNDHDSLATPGTVLGPCHVANAPTRAFGASLIDTDDGGQHLRVRGVVRCVDGTPIPGASIDVWSCASNGEFVVVHPRNHSIPMDGPVGRLTSHRTLANARRACSPDCHGPWPSWGDHASV
jgi:hydroxyquinol 1,2-dioxygenase